MSRKDSVNPIAAATILPGQMMATALHFQAHMMEQSATIAFEYVDFLRTRTAQDLATTREIGRCGSAEDVFRLLGEAQKTAMADYACEAARLSMHRSFVVDALQEEIAEDAAVVTRAVSRVAAA
jgi:hypothetical protein